MVEDEQELRGGNASESAVRIGHTSALGQDEDGRHVVEYVEGVLAMDQLPLVQGDLLRMIRDLAPWNLITGDRWVFMGWCWPLRPAAGPGTMFDLLKASNEAGFQPSADMYVNGG